jgi:hypothetical protein
MYGTFSSNHYEGRYTFHQRTGWCSGPVPVTPLCTVQCIVRPMLPPRLGAGLVHNAAHHAPSSQLGEKLLDVLPLSTAALLHVNIPVSLLNITYARESVRNKRVQHIHGGSHLQRPHWCLC